MEQIKRVIVGLDFSATDQYVLKAVHHYDRLLNFEKIYLMHVIRDLDHPHYKSKQGEPQPLDEQLKSLMMEEVSHYFDGDSTKVDYMVKEGNLGTEVLKWQKVKQADLLMFGRKEKFTDTNLYGILNLAPCSVAFIPKNEEALKFDTVLLPIDGGEESVLAFEFAKRMKARMQAKIDLVNAYSLPQGYSFSGKSPEEFKSIMEENERKNIDEFLAEHEWTDEVNELHHLYLDRYDTLAGSLAEFINKTSNTAVVIGSQARTKLTRLLMGTKVKQLIEEVPNKLIFVVKDKNETFDFLDMISKI